MYKIFSENKGFYKLEKDGVFYNISSKRFNEYKAQGLILEKEITENIEENIGENIVEKQDLTKLSQVALLEIALRLGFVGDVKAKKATLIEFIEKN